MVSLLKLCDIFALTDAHNLFAVTTHCTRLLVTFSV